MLALSVGPSAGLVADRERSSNGDDALPSAAVTSSTRLDPAARSRSRLCVDSVIAVQQIKAHTTRVSTAQAGGVLVRSLLEDERVPMGYARPVDGGDNHAALARPTR